MDIDGVKKFKKKKKKRKEKGITQLLRRKWANALFKKQKKSSILLSFPN